MSALFEPWFAPEPTLVWGIFTRMLGLILAISFLSMSGQVVVAAGRTGGMPVYLRLAKIREDFPTWKRFLYFPTLLWLNASDRALRTYVWVGFLSALSVIYGGAHTPYALGICYICYLTLDMPMGLIFPWDCLLFECTVLSLFLPALLPLPELTATAAPPPLVAWAYRIAVFRVMFGFGKLKFFGATKDDAVYLKGFLTAQPLPSPIGWYAQKLPASMLKLLLVYMFLVEIPIPFFVFFPGNLSLIAAVTIGFLMVGIQAMGSFGYFSMLTITVCVTLLDNQTPRAVEWGALFGPGAPNVANAYVILHTLGALVAFPFNSWVGQSWSHWSFWYRIRPRWLAWPAHAMRAVHPFRVCHPYGVFPPKAFPEVKGSVVVEVSWDEKTWVECDFSFFCSSPMSKPRFVAPHHPRGDQAVIYETYGLNPTSLIASVAGPWEPYAYGTQPAAAVLLQRILEGYGKKFVRCDAFDQHGDPPKLARIITVMLEPASLAEHRQTGAYWKRSYLGPHAPPRGRDPDFWKHLMPEPELWHWEAIAWRRRSKLRVLMDRAKRGEDPNVAVVADTDTLGPEDVTLFWDDFVPEVGLEDRVNWDNLPKTRERLSRYDAAQMRRLERMLGRFSVMLAERLEPHYLGHGLKNAPIPVKTYLHLWMLIQHIIGKGREAYEAVYREPLKATEHIADMTIYSGMYYLCIFRFDQMAFDAQKMRLMQSILGPYTEEPPPLTPVLEKVIGLLNTLFGYWEVAELVKQHFKGPDYDRGYPERYPKFAIQSSGEVKLVTRAMGAPTDPLASPGQ